MAVDTKQKRQSAIHITLPWRGIYPDADGTVGTADRLHAAWMYSGIAASAPVVVAEIPYDQLRHIVRDIQRTHTVYDTERVHLVRELTQQHTVRCT